MSNMPKFEDVAAEHTMRMERLIVQDHPCTVEETLIDLVSRASGKTTRAVVNLHKVQDSRIDGYLPSKVWIEQREDGANLYHMSFYCSPTLPAGARPFGDGPMYCFAICVDAWTTVEYDVELRIFVDQIIVGNKAWYVFVFGENMLDRVVAKKKGTE